VLGYFDWERKDYLRTPIEEQIEVASLSGDVALGQNGEPALVAADPNRDARVIAVSIAG